MRRAVRTRPDENGAVAVVVAVFASAVFFGLGALSVDVSRWYLEAQRAQKAADAAALAGVTWMPQDLAQATAAARDVAARNGFPVASSVTVKPGTRPSELDVTVSSRVSNVFGQLLGLPTTTVSRHSVADYTGPQPMASPCNTLGNEPDGSPGAGPIVSQLLVPTGASCSRTPQFWMSVHGPEVFKTQGDQYGVRYCAGGESGCAPDGRNSEFRPEGYFLMLRVEAAAVGQSIDVQLYDPAYAATNSSCGGGPSGSFPVGPGRDSWNPYATTDATTRYAKTPGTFCSGDEPNQGRRRGPEQGTITSYSLREPADDLNPLTATPVAGCTRQFPGYVTSAVNVNTLREGQPGYNPALARVFHQWVPLCTFTPTRAGDYYLQVRTNVALGGAVDPATGSYRPANPATSRVVTQTGDDPSVMGNGSNRFAVRAYGPTAGTISMAAWDRMPIFANADSAAPVFNLIRVLPGAAGKTLVFNFFDVGDAASNGTMTVLPPTDATGGALTNCKASGFKVLTLATCSLSGISKNTGWDGQSETISVPIPPGYTCDYNHDGGCWFRVQVSFGSGSVTDATTWSASIAGDPVRLVE
jgi:hypothetical protein